MKRIIVLIIYILPVFIYATKVKLDIIKEQSCLNCFYIKNSPVNKGFKLTLNKNKKLVYGKFYKDYLLEFNDIFYYLYRIELSQEDSRTYMSLKIVSVGMESNVKFVFNLSLIPYKLFKNYNDFEGRKIEFLGWKNQNTFNVKVDDTTYYVKLFLVKEKDNIVVYAESKVL